MKKEEDFSKKMQLERTEYHTGKRGFELLQGKDDFVVNTGGGCWESFYDI